MSGTGPLTGVRVLDMTQFEAGTVCTETLAWMGAEVWKVERPVTGEQGRYSVVSPDVDTFGFIILNMNKESITCNAKKPEGLALLKKLAAQADVFIENMGPGSVERLGLGYDVLKEINPRIIYTQMKGFGMDGPYADYPAFAPIGLLVPQTRVGESVERLQINAPLTWKYLQNHLDYFQNRKSAVYNKMTPFSIFGVGDYAFAPWKVAISGL